MSRVFVHSTHSALLDTSWRLFGMLRFRRSIFVAVICLAVSFQNKQAMCAQDFELIYPAFPVNEVTNMLQ